MSHWPLTPDDISRPAYRSLAQAIAAAISAGSLRAGDRLPTHRKLAWDLDVSVQTVSRAYEELIRADLVAGEVGRGTFVNSLPPETLETPWHSGMARLPRHDLSLLTPVALPRAKQAWIESLHRLADHADHSALHELRPELTAARYLDIATDWLARCGLVVGGRRVLITNGVTPAMFVALSSVLTAGDMIAAEPLTTHTLIQAARHLNLQVQGIECDARGMIPEALKDAAETSAGQMKAVFLMPSGAAPNPQIMDKERREALAEAALEAGLILLESDPLGPLPARRPPPVASFAPRQAFYFTGLTKCLAPGLRLGFLVMPEGLFEHATNRHLSISWMATPLIAEIARDWIDNGKADKILADHRVELAARNRLAQSILGPRCQGGLHTLHRWLSLPPDMDEDSFMARALEQDVAVAAGSGFAVSDQSPAVRVSLGAGSRRDLERALRALAEVVPEF
ncbi:PLP-dependent aminotransferase family protein [Celeribacter sp. PS-C1]|uniref:MocR-like ectoine utilization transcription factor EhuR n=1 Tax=Celeribacter sp. PS-C1 TaxID=2820813 RepID=UPI001C683E14|nr:PLP-dependent aminotransferase family protein [Celeribacter sp. PS-C1]MBW6419108.1 PLP-dependent aminotransferase family protein [Celeribacter sp. PS-C1]